MYFVVFVKDNIPSINSLSSKRELVYFLSSFVKDHGSLDDGQSNWIDHVFKGKKLQPESLVKVKT